MDLPDNDDSEISPPEALTSIGHTYTLAATNEAKSELDEIMVRHFVETVAEIALAIASRKTRGEA